LLLECSKLNLKLLLCLLKELISLLKLVDLLFKEIDRSIFLKQGSLLFGDRVELGFKVFHLALEGF
jgi:hypothetical protein